MNRREGKRARALPAPFPQPRAAVPLGWVPGSVMAMLVAGCTVGGGAAFPGPEVEPTSAAALSAGSTSVTSSTVDETLRSYCVTCHNERTRTAGLALDGYLPADPASHPEVWEKVIRKLRAGTMPPGGMPRPESKTYDSIATWLETSIDDAWWSDPKPGRINAVHRLNRTEYNNAINDLLGLDVDIRSLLPGDATADGSFDNFANALSLTTAHLERYMSVARQVTRLATGLPPISPVIETFEVPLHVVQDSRQGEDLPFGSRGGLAIRHQFPVDGEYLLRVRLRANWQDYIMGLGWPQRFDVRVDSKLVGRFEVGGEAPGTASPASFSGPGEPGSIDWEQYMFTADDDLEVRVPIEAGPHVVSVSYVRELWEPEGVPQPVQRGRLLANDELYMDYQAVHSLEIGGPYGVMQTGIDTPSRRRIFSCQPAEGGQAEACAAEILSAMARRAYRRPIAGSDLEKLLTFYRSGRDEGGSFESGIQFALEFLLTSPEFLMRVYRDPPEVTEQNYRLNDLELASRLSFFLWSSIPDDALLDAAEKGALSHPDVYAEHVSRMLVDPKATDAFVHDFAAQWLNLRRVGEVIVIPEFYPNFDESLLQAFQAETELFLAENFREDRSILELLRADYTFVNERLARHYGIPGIYGSRLRKVPLPNLEQRGGLLGHGGLLAATSYPGRTSPVLRGKWLLDNLLGSPPPPPPPGLNTSLEEERGAVASSIRERLAQHRTDPVCSSCHSVIDPLGFALENFDAIGGWRTVDEAGNPVDARGTMPDGEEIEGLRDVRRVLLSRPDQFVHTVTEKLMAYALGRRVEYYDQPAIRRIVRDAAVEDYRWSAVLEGIAKSPPFLMRSPARYSN